MMIVIFAGEVGFEREREGGGGGEQPLLEDEGDQVAGTGRGVARPGAAGGGVLLEQRIRLLLLLLLLLVGVGDADGPDPAGRGSARCRRGS